MNDNALEQARLLFLEGIGHFQSGDFLAAHGKFSAALKLAPERPSVLLNLGITHVSLGQHAQAIPLLQKSLAAEPDSPEGWTALAVAQFETHDWLGAAQAFEQAFARNVNQQPAQLQYAQCLVRLGQSAAAIEVYRHVLAKDNQSIESWYQLGELYRGEGRLAEAIASYRQAQTLGADPDLIRFVLAALGDGPVVQRPPALYVQGLFDHYSGEFEAHLVGQLQYQAHRILAELLPSATIEAFDRVLDLGCGTGLCGEVLRPRTRWLAGVDVSTAMLARAKARGIYDELSQQDIVSFLADDTQTWNLVVAADVLNYVGDLQPLFEQLCRRMSAGGIFTFTTESADEARAVVLAPNLRYAHGSAYVTEMARRFGFVVEGHWQAPLRSEAGLPMIGEYWRLRHAAAAAVGTCASA